MLSLSGGWRALGQPCLLDISCVKTQGLSFGLETFRLLRKHFGSSFRFFYTQGWSIWDHQRTVWTVELVTVCCLKTERDFYSLNEPLVDIICRWRRGWFCKSVMVHQISQVLGLLFFCLFCFFFNCHQYWSFPPKMLMSFWCKLNSVSCKQDEVLRSTDCRWRTSKTKKKKKKNGCFPNRPDLWLFCSL